MGYWLLILELIFDKNSQKIRINEMAFLF